MSKYLHILSDLNLCKVLHVARPNKTETIVLVTFSYQIVQYVTGLCFVLITGLWLFTNKDYVASWLSDIADVSGSQE